MIDWDKPVQTKEGRSVRIYTRSGQQTDYPVVGEKEFIKGSWEPSCWSLVGQWDGSGTSCDDLVNVPQKRAGWLNLYHTETIHKTKEAADRQAQPGRVACIEVTFTEGEGLAETDASE